MEKNKRKPQTVDEYIAAYPKRVQEKLEELRSIIRKTALEAQERISYKMPAYYLNGNLVYFGAFTNHIGFYPTASGIANFKKEFGKYSYSKGAVQFPIEEPFPRELIKEIVRFRIKENKIKRKQ
jgi:uncharacterized protein YdhG (YjbR/CyaY superfamily)